MSSHWSDLCSWLLWVQGESRSTWFGVRVEGTQVETNREWKGFIPTQKDEGCNFCCALISDLPCMHLDPGVNRLGLNITSVHQTDRRPVTPDIVFPICVILWPQEEGLNKQNKNKTQTAKQREVNTFHIYAHSRAHASTRSVLVLAWKEIRVITEQQPKHANERGRAISTAKLHSKRAEHLWEVQTADVDNSCGATLEGLCARKTKPGCSPRVCPFKRQQCNFNSGWRSCQTAAILGAWFYL